MARHHLQFQNTIAGDGLFEGYASVFGIRDMANDEVLPGAFRDSLARRGVRAIKMLFQHDPAQPIGVWTQIREDERGLYVRGRIVADVMRARELFALMRAGAIDGLSIGFKTIRGRRDPRSGTRLLEKIDLWEISLVTFPLLPEARVNALKAAAPPDTLFAYPLAGRLAAAADLMSPTH